MVNSNNTHRAWNKGEKQTRLSPSTGLKSATVASAAHTTLPLRAKSWPFSKVGGSSRATRQHGEIGNRKKKKTEHQATHMGKRRGEGQKSREEGGGCYLRGSSRDLT